MYKELKKGGQEAFKKKVLFKLNYCIGLVCLQNTCTEWVVNQQKEMIKDGRQEMAYLMFTATSGEWMKNADKSVASSVRMILQKLQLFIEENQSTFQKSSSMKQLVLLLKPLEELIKSVGMKSEWRDKII